MSRGTPISQDDVKGTCEEDEKVVCSVSMRKESALLTALRSDPDYAPVIETLNKGDMDKEIRLSVTSEALKVANFVIDEGQLKILLEDGTAALVVPKEYRKAAFEEHHSGPMAGHHSAKKMFSQLKKGFLLERYVSRHISMG